MEKQVERNRAKAASRKGGSSLGYQRSQPRPDMVSSTSGVLELL